MHKEEFSVHIIYVQYIHLTKAEPIHKRQTHLVTDKDYDRKGSAAKQNLWSSAQGAWRQDELIRGKQPVVK
jgi:hypothetical protein